MPRSSPFRSSGGRAGCLGTTLSGPPDERGERARRPLANEFLTDIETLRRNARAHIEEGPITEAYGAERERVISVLNEVVATELVCVLLYKHLSLNFGRAPQPTGRDPSR